MIPGTLDGATSSREDLLREDHGRHGAHPEEAHHPHREEDHHEAPAAADAEEPVLHPHAQRAASTRPPAVEHEVERAPAVPQADVLQRCQLVKARGNDGAAGHVWAGAVPGQPA